jgi:hypothetical protein
MITCLGDTGVGLFVVEIICSDGNNIIGDNIGVVIIGAETGIGAETEIGAETGIGADIGIGAGIDDVID